MNATNRASNLRITALGIAMHGLPGAGVTPLAAATFGEPMPGVYAIELRHTNGASLDAGSHAIVVSIDSVGGDKSVGRTILRLEA